MVSDGALSPPDKDARKAKLGAVCAFAKVDISEREIIIDPLRVQISRIKRITFGKSSEKLDLHITQVEVALEELEAETVVSDARSVEPVLAYRAFANTHLAGIGAI